MAVAWFALAVIGAVMLVVNVMSSAALAERVGLAHAERAVVESRVDREQLASRGLCSRITRYEVDWFDGSGYFTTCTTRAELEEGDPVTVAVAPWTREVSAERDIDLGWSIVGFIVSGALILFGVRGARRYRRLRFGGDGTEIRGRIATVRGSRVTVLPDPDEPDQRRLVLLPAAARIRGSVGTPVGVWGSRSGWRGRPRGPWVIQAGDDVSIATHAWRRR